MPGQVVDTKLPEPRIRVFRATVKIYKQGKKHSNNADFEGNLKMQKLLQQWLQIWVNEITFKLDGEEI